MVNNMVGILLLGAGGLYLVKQGSAQGEEETKKSQFTKGSGQGQDMANLTTSQLRKAMGQVPAYASELPSQQAPALPSVIINEGSTQTFFVQGETGTVAPSSSGGGGTYSKKTSTGVPVGTYGTSSSGTPEIALSSEGSKKLSAYSAPSTPSYTPAQTINRFISNVGRTVGGFFGGLF